MRTSVYLLVIAVWLTGVNTGRYKLRKSPLKKYLEIRRAYKTSIAFEWFPKMHTLTVVVVSIMDSFTINLNLNFGITEPFDVN